MRWKKASVECWGGREGGGLGSVLQPPALGWVAAIEIQRRDGGKDGRFVLPGNRRLLSSVGRGALGHPRKGNESDAHSSTSWEEGRTALKSLLLGSLL